MSPAPAKSVIAENLPEKVVLSRKKDAKRTQKEEGEGWFIRT